LEDKKPYAALAFIESFKTDSPQLELLKAHSLRKIGKQAEAEAIYTKLTESCVSAYAYQGLGLISNLRNKPSDSVKYLKMATKLLPINTNIRNDYGYALMQVGDYPSSLSEFFTAIELDDRNTRAKYNLLALLYKSNQKVKADQFAKRYNIPDADPQETRKDEPVNQPTGNKELDNGQAMKSSKVCTSDSDVCTGIFSMKLESYTYE
jgi:Flp pilus assembly protein TadD